VENTLLDGIVVGSIYLEQMGTQKIANQRR
jgi:hypothetical protein